MANNQEMYCKHCKKHTLFMLESDLRWYCDECGNVYGSIPPDWIEDEDAEVYDFMEDDYFEDDQIEDESLEGGGYIDSWDFEDIDVGNIIMCSLCNNLVEIDELIDGYLCPICLEDLSDQLENDEEL